MSARNFGVDKSVSLAGNIKKNFGEVSLVTKIFPAVRNDLLLRKSVKKHRDPLIYSSGLYVIEKFRLYCSEASFLFFLI